MYIRCIYYIYINHIKYICNNHNRREGKLNLDACLLTYSIYQFTYRYSTVVVVVVVVVEWVYHIISYHIIS